MNLRRLGSLGLRLHIDFKDAYSFNTSYLDQALFKNRHRLRVPHHFTILYDSGNLLAINLTKFYRGLEGANLNLPGGIGHR